MLKIKEEYNKRREEIYYMIHDAYMDKCILEYIERINKLVECGERHFESNSKHVVQHMIYLTISDLVLNICKICHDKKRWEGKKTAIERLEECLNELLEEKGLTPIEVVGEISKEYGDDIKKLADSRNKVIAHNDLDKNEEQNIGTDDILKIYKLLDKITDVYNRLADPSVDGEVKQIGKKCLKKMLLNTYLGFTPMIQSCYRKTSNSLQGEDGNGSKS